MSKPTFDPRVHLLEAPEEDSRLELDYNHECSPESKVRSASYSNYSESSADSARGESPRPASPSSSKDYKNPKCGELGRLEGQKTAKRPALSPTRLAGNDARQALQVKSWMSPVSHDDVTITQSNTCCRGPSTSRDVVTVKNVKIAPKNSSLVSGEQINEDNPGRRAQVSGKQKSKRQVSAESWGKTTCAQDLQQKKSQNNDLSSSRHSPKQESEELDEALASLLLEQGMGNMMDQGDARDGQKDRSKNESNILDDEALARRLFEESMTKMLAQTGNNECQGKGSKNDSELDDEALARSLFQKSVADMMAELGSGGGQGNPNNNEPDTVDDEALARSLFERSMSNMMAQVDGFALGSKSSDDDAALARQLLALEANSCNNTFDKNVEIAKKMLLKLDQKSNQMEKTVDVRNSKGNGINKERDAEKEQRRREKNADSSRRHCAVERVQPSVATISSVRKGRSLRPAPAKADLSAYFDIVSPDENDMKMVS